MILGQISYIDCFVFLVFLAPQLLLDVGLFATLSCAIRALPFFLIQLPYQYIRDRFFLRASSQAPFVRKAFPFQDFVIRCVRYAFANIPASIGRVFFSKRVALPFLRFRMLRHGYLRSPIYWKEVHKNGMKGVYIVHDELSPPDVLIYYCHGGGFSMGSTYFYLEYLLFLLTSLRALGFRNPAIFALEYTLVPLATYPAQIHETLAGYRFCLEKAPSPNKICVSGDSAGATLVLSLLLHLSLHPSVPENENGRPVPLPGMALLVSPWTTLTSPLNQNTPSDYLNASTLHHYARQYAGEELSPAEVGDRAAVGKAAPSREDLDDPLVSPGRCKDLDWWRRAAPRQGFLVMYGEEEVFKGECENFVRTLTKAGVEVEGIVERGGIHAWPIVELFLGEGRGRTRGVGEMAMGVWLRLGEKGRMVNGD